MGIAHDIRAHTQIIAERWEREVSSSLPALAALSRAALVDHLPEMLEGLAAWTEGDEQDARLGFEALVDGHALQRHAAGIDLETVTSEYAVLRHVILGVLIEHVEPTALVGSLQRLAEGIDRAIAEAVKRYAKAQDHVRERFIGILAHDLRDPLTAVMMSSAMLAESTLVEKQTVLVDRITRGAKRIERMIDDVLDFARGRLEGGIPIVPRLADMREICLSAIDEARAATSRQVRLEATGDLRGHWDRERVRQAIANLLSNARTYGQGEVVVRAWERDDRQAVLTAVTNYGPAIAAELLARIFDPFARAPQSHRSGLGLGLFIVEQIARGHSGRVFAESTEDGTTFTIEWPRVPIEQMPDRPR
jgi:signal transduction histidine kinase